MLALRVVCARGGHGSPQRWGQWLPETTAVIFFGLLHFVRSENFATRTTRDARSRLHKPPVLVVSNVLSFINGVTNELSLSIDAPEHPV